MQLFEPNRAWVPFLPQRLNLGSDFLRHEDIIPFTPDDATPMPTLHDEMAGNDDDNISADRLIDWPLGEDAPTINLYKTCKHGIEVTGFASCVKKQRTNGDQTIYQFYYTIMFNNTTSSPVRLIERTMMFAEDLDSERLDMVNGLGVLGVQPQLDTKHPTHRYSSWTTMSSPHGWLGGYFTFVNLESPELLHIPIPTIPLDHRDNVLTGPI